MHALDKRRKERKKERKRDCTGNTENVEPSRIMLWEVFFLLKTVCQKVATKAAEMKEESIITTSSSHFSTQLNSRQFGNVNTECTEVKRTAGKEKSNKYQSINKNK